MFSYGLTYLVQDVQLHKTESTLGKEYTQNVAQLCLHETNNFADRLALAGYRTATEDYLNKQD